MPKETADVVAQYSKLLPVSSSACRQFAVRRISEIDAKCAFIYVKPDLRFHAVCHQCGGPAGAVHSKVRRSVRDLNVGPAVILLCCEYRKVYCPKCQGARVEDLGLFDASSHVTRRLAREIHDLCKKLTVSDVARRFGLDWKTVKDIDKAFLETDYGETDYTDLRILAIDEIAVRKGHRSMTVVLDYLTGRVVWMGDGRTYEALSAFFKGMTKEQKEKIEAVAMDMWDPFIKAVKEHLPHAKIVFDLFHVVASFSKVIDQVRISECQKARKEDKPVYQGTKYLLLTDSKNLRRKKHRLHLKELLALHAVLCIVMILKEDLKRIWSYKSRAWAQRRLQEWCAKARAVGHPEVEKFAEMLEKHAYGILNHCDYPIHTSKLEGINNKIKVIKRKAYGYLDPRYFTLKVIQAFDPTQKKEFEVVFV